jgi:hypothetical protein
MVVLLQLIFFVNNVLSIVENPKGSKLELCDSFQWFTKLLQLLAPTLGIDCKWRKHSDFMMNFMGDTEKGLWFYSRHPFIGELQDYRQKRPRDEIVEKKDAHTYTSIYIYIYKLKCTIDRIVSSSINHARTCRNE